MSQPKTFTEIAKAIGCTKQAVFVSYLRAMAKIRARPEAVSQLRELVRMKTRREA